MWTRLPEGFKEDHAKERGGQLLREDQRPKIVWYIPGTESDIWPNVKKIGGVLNKPETLHTSEFVISLLNTSGEVGQIT